MTEVQAREDLAVIRRFLEEGRRDVVDRGKHFLIWGTISGVGLLLTYAAATGRAVPDPSWVWAGLLAVGWAASMVVGWREGRGARVTTLPRRLLTGVWVASAVSLTLVGVAGMFGSVLPASALSGVLAAVMAVPVLMTSLLTGERWLAGVAVGWWIAGAVMLLVPGVYALLVMAALSVLLLAVPGWVLNAKARRRAAA